jgi:ubiquinone/menaquinone biosynthesis C-methylase UbiE
MSEINKRILEVSPYVVECYLAQIKAFSNVEYNYINEIIRNNKIDSVLDVGTGEGSFISRYASENPDVRFLAVDADKDLLSLAKKKHRFNNLVFKKIVFGSSFLYGPFDLILARFAVEHMKNVPGFINEAYDRLNKGGLLVITEYYIVPLHSKNEEWNFFREKELELYMKFGSHPRISLDIPVNMRGAGFNAIESNFRHVSPATAGSQDFYDLIISYAHAYASIEPGIWTNKVKSRVVKYCKNSLKKKNKDDAVLLISHAIGRK